ncbi:MAG: hypothetical protein LBI45_02475 [Bacteroidales bacterium]|jgi:hypothetical protein|nr:hypothetical protein [Bacteroidales bacterium]
MKKQIKKLLLIGLFLSSLSMKCSDGETIICSDCSDKESVLEAVYTIAEKKFGYRIDKFETHISEEYVDCYTISFFDTRDTKDTLTIRKGGRGGFIKISKKDCEVLDYKLYQ